MTVEEAIKALRLMEHVESITAVYEPGEARNNTTVRELKEACRIVVDRLASYEATGLEPREIEEMVRFMDNYYIDDWTRFSEIMQAEHEGRLAILPTMEIMCSRCGCTKRFVYSLSAVRLAVAQGWNSFGSALYCPDCSATWSERNRRPLSGEANTIRAIGAQYKRMVRIET